MCCIWFLFFFFGYGFELFIYLKLCKSGRIFIFIFKVDSVEEELNIVDNIYKILYFKGVKNYMKFDFMWYIFIKFIDLWVIIIFMKVLLVDNLDIRRLREVEVVRFFFWYFCLFFYRFVLIIGKW